MTIQLSPQAEALIRQKVDSGLYSTPDVAIDVAVRLLDQYDRRLVQLRNSVGEGFSAIERGEGIELTPELMDDIEREAEEACRRGEQPHPDACP
jgi:antitoxin ParD1/3/4